MTYKYYQKLNDPTTDAIVLKSKIIKDDGKYKTYRLTVKYTIDDKEYINKITKDKCIKDYVKDDKVIINYKKENPNIIEIEVLRNYSKDGESMLIQMVCIYFCSPLFILMVLVGVVGGGGELQGDSGAMGLGVDNKLLISVLAVPLFGLLTGLMGMFI